jgi:putative nucleotidyltransferase with HDIG domain
MRAELTPQIAALIKFYFSVASVKHPQVREHSERVAVLAYNTAKILQKDIRAAYLAGVFHDIGKVLLPHELFSGRDIDAEEYKVVKNHALLGFSALKDHMLFTALCCGLHHAVQKSGGYGISLADFPVEICSETAKKVLEVATLVSICDFIDAYSTRTTLLKDGTVLGADLRGLLETKYPNDVEVIDAALVAGRKVHHVVEHLHH